MLGIGLVLALLLVIALIVTRGAPLGHGVILQLQYFPAKLCNKCNQIVAVRPAGKQSKNDGIAAHVAQAAATYMQAARPDKHP